MKRWQCQLRVSVENQCHYVEPKTSTIPSLYWPLQYLFSFLCLWMHSKVNTAKYLPADIHNFTPKAEYRVIFADFRAVTGRHTWKTSTLDIWWLVCVDCCRLVGDSPSSWRRCHMTASTTSPTTRAMIRSASYQLLSHCVCVPNDQVLSSCLFFVY